MSAFNWIIYSDTCPACGAEAQIRCQTHFCSDYAGDETGRFHDRTYTIGEPMAWWPRSDKRFAEWDQSTKMSPAPGEPSSECCYAKCLNCRAELYVVIRFEGLRPEEALEIGKESDWPKDHYK